MTHQTVVENSFQETEMGLIPKDWKVVKLGDVAETKSGGTPSRKKADYFTGNIPWVKSGELNDNVIYSTEEKITKEALSNSSARIFPKGTLLMAMYGATVGKTAILGMDASTNQAVCAIFPKNKSFLSEFMKYHLAFIRPKLLSERFGGAQPNISQTIVRNTKIVLPPIPEQKKIGKFLGIIQKAVEQQDKIIEAVKNLKKSLMQKLFTEGLHEGEQKEAKFSLMPVSWELVRLNEVGEIVTGTTPSTKKREYYGNMYMFISPADLGLNKYVQKANKFLSEEGLSVSRVLPKDSVLVTCIGSTIGKTGLTSGEKSATNQQINAIICNASVNPHFLYYWLSFYEDYLRSFQAKIAVPILNKSNFEKIEISRPSICEQEQIAWNLSTVDKKMEIENRKKAILKEFFKTMLHKLMTGEIRLKDVEV